MLMERGGDSEDDGGSAPPCPDSDPARNPSPPPGYDAEEEEDEEEEGGPEGDAIGNTVYSKHWLFGALTRLVQVAAEQGAGDPEAREELGEEDEEQLCKVWDMAADQDVARFLQEFKAADILLGAIAKSGSPRLTEICVGILGNMACFPDACRSISENEDLGVVLLLLLSDGDPPTLLETSRLLLTCLARPSAAPLWLERVRQQESVRQSLCFIMCSSTNVDLLLKVGELVDKLFDLDEELMRSWITPQAQPSTTDGEGPLHIAPCLLEAAKQLRSESPEGLEVYIHALQLLTTVDTGIQALVEPEQVAEELWALLSDVVCSDLCQPDDPAVTLQEQKTLLAPVLAVLGALFHLQGRPECCCPDRNLPLVGSLTRVLQYQQECQQGAAEDQDVHLQILKETAAELLSGLLAGLPQARPGAGFEREGPCSRLGRHTSWVGGV
uniref:Serum amyloid A-like 1 n=1 Tax=Lepisosteus oculatus TaxID=7918 RepID=W5MIH5_LEPOC|nr:PREDICTED: protein SAAL1 [Lepisosteus oculatus]